MTGALLPMSEHGFSAMNSEIFDYDFDGEPVLYVTNISAYPVLGRGNVFWKRQPDQSFQNVAKELGVTSCGWSWAGKFADFDLNGKNELFVINGGYSGESESSASYWYYQSLRDGIPMWLRGVSSRIDRIDFNYSGYQKDCMFEEQDGTFVNIAEQAGVADQGDGRGLALMDINNDGLLDLIVANQTGPLRIFINHSKPAKSWLGFIPINKAGSTVPHGARITGTLKDGRKLMREIYPLNGHNGQSDPRVVVAVDSADDLKRVEVQWSKDHRENYSDFKLNAYNTLRQVR